MEKEDFQKLWTINYPDTIPSSYLFKLDYPNKWFRIHSLPESKRYASNEDEWKILLDRQNDIITDVLGIDTSIFLVTGEYIWDNELKTPHITESEKIFSPFVFTRLDDINIGQDGDPEFYRPAFAHTVWKVNYHNNILIEIARDNIRAFFVSFDKNVIVAPYDGGVDFILKDSLTKEYYKQKYNEWLSKREDGF